MEKLLAAIALFAFAALSYGATNASPFGLEVGVATLANVVQATDQHQATLKENGLNKFSGGKMFESTSNFDVDGVNSVLFIFSPAEVLTGVVVNMAKDPVSLSKSFAKKYKVVASKIDTFMNNGSAQYKQGSSVIIIDAQHLNFHMTVLYATKALYDSFNGTNAGEKAVKKAKKESSL